MAERRGTTAQVTEGSASLENRRYASLTLCAVHLVRRPWCQSHLSVIPAQRPADGDNAHLHVKTGRLNNAAFTIDDDKKEHANGYLERDQVHRGKIRRSAERTRLVFAQS